jgi:hypothetical protein
MRKNDICYLIYRCGSVGIPIRQDGLRGFIGHLRVISRIIKEGQRGKIRPSDPP